jgi:hypothetical protein
MTLLLHKGAELVPYEQLHSVVPPAPTRSHVPLPHHQLVDMAKYALGYFGHEVVEEQHGLMPDGMEYFGLLTLKSDYGDYTDTCGLRNSHSKRFPIGVSFGAKCFVCDNLSFCGVHVVKKKHTPNALRLLPGLLAEIVEPLADQRQAQQRTFDRYRTAALTDQQADHAIMQLYRTGAINLQRIADVEREWQEPSFEGFEERNAWRLFNATTHALAGRVSENPSATKQVHDVIDGVCHTVH